MKVCRLKTPSLSIVIAGIVGIIIFKNLVVFTPNKLNKHMAFPSDEILTLEEEEQTVSDTNNATRQQPQRFSKEIRKWGCHRTETPLIFVHIGKAGGGEVRARLAGAAEAYDREEWHNPSKDDHFYPVRYTARGSSRNHSSGDDPDRFRRGRFCNSKYPHHKYIPDNNQTTPLSNIRKNFEGLSFCNATTPFGMSIGCPNNYRSMGYKYRPVLCESCDDDYYLEQSYYDTVDERGVADAVAKVFDPPPAGHTCDLVYVSHSSLGGEMNWLPPRYLKEHWWDNSPWKNENKNSDELEPYWTSFLSDRKFRRRDLLDFLNKTKKFVDWSDRSEKDDNEDYDYGDNSQRWCPAGYTFKSVSGTQYDRPKRATSDWKENESLYLNCTKPIAEDADRAFLKFWNEHEQGRSDRTHDANYSPVYASMPLHRVTMVREPWSWLLSKFYWDAKIYSFNSCKIGFRMYSNPTLNWIEVFSLQYLFYLCGFECETRYENKMITLEGIEAQAEDNLRNAFSVVGLLEESDSFYDMIHKRIDYIDLQKPAKDYNLRHESKAKFDYWGCRELFMHDEVFRESLRSSTPEFAALERLYHVAVEVNRFQREELSQCAAK